MGGEPLEVIGDDQVYQEACSQVDQGLLGSGELLFFVYEGGQGKAYACEHGSNDLGSEAFGGIENPV